MTTLSVSEGPADKPLIVNVRAPSRPDPVEVQVTLTDEAGQPWVSRGLYDPNPDGWVDTGSQASLGGTYTGIDPGGLVWSMWPISTGRRTERHGGISSSGEALVDVVVKQNGRVCAVAERRPRATTADLVELRIDGPGVSGVLFSSAVARSAPAPGVVILGGWDGGLETGTARLLASRGYAALALHYFGVGDLTPRLERVPIEVVQRGLDRLAAHPGVDETRVGLIGCSAGADGVLLAAALSPEPRPVIAYVPSGFVTASLYGRPGAPSWTFGGADLPYLELAEHACDSQRLFHTCSRALTRTHTDAAAIDVDAIGGDVLLVSAGADGIYPSVALCQRIMQRLSVRDGGRTAEHLICAGAGHHIAPPPMRPSTLSSVHRGPTRWELGGSPRATAHGRMLAWNRSLAFLRRALGAEPELPARPPTAHA